MVNTNKLRAKIVEQGMSVEEVSKAIGLNRCTLYRKLKAGADGFNVGDVTRLSSILKLSGEDIHSIFFAPDVA